MTSELTKAATLSQDEFDQAEAIFIGLLRESYPTLDLRRGTALRDLLVRPSSAAYALETRRNDELMRTRSLAAIIAQPGVDDTDAINAVLANFGTELRLGYGASGVLKVTVNAPGSYRANAGTVFTNSETSASYTAPASVAARSADTTLRGPDSDGLYYFTVPVISDAAESVSEGVAFTLAIPFSGYVAAVSYSAFTAGREDETPSEALARLPKTLASRGLVTRAAIETAFRDPTSPGYNSSVSALSIQGMGDPAQQRDRHNVHGVPLGGRIDVYARTFSTPPVITLVKNGELQVDGSYRILVQPSEAPGLYAVKSVTYASDVLQPGDESEGPLDFTVTRLSLTGAAPAHRFTAEDPTIGTVYHGVEIYVNGYNFGDTAPVFKVSLYAARDVELLQAYVDRPDVRNAAADVLVRTPFMCIVGLNVVVRHAPGVVIDVAALRQALTNVVNRNSFYGILTMSELVAAAHTYPIISVDTASGRSGGFALRGRVVDGAGVEHTLQGHRIDVADILDPTGLMTRQTVAFTTSPDLISVEAVAA